MKISRSAAWLLDASSYLSPEGPNAQPVGMWRRGRAANEAVGYADELENLYDRTGVWETNAARSLAFQNLGSMISSTMLCALRDLRVKIPSRQEHAERRRCWISIRL